MSNAYSNTYEALLPPDLTVYHKDQFLKQFLIIQAFYPSFSLSQGHMAPWITITLKGGHDIPCVDCRQITAHIFCIHIPILILIRKGLHLLDMKLKIFFNKLRRPAPIIHIFTIMIGWIPRTFIRSISLQKAMLNNISSFKAYSLYRRPSFLKYSNR